LKRITTAAYLNGVVGQSAERGTGSSSAPPTARVS